MIAREPQSFTCGLLHVRWLYARRRVSAVGSRFATLGVGQGFPSSGIQGGSVIACPAVPVESQRPRAGPFRFAPPINVSLNSGSM